MNTKVFVVISNSGSFDNYISQIEGIFSTEEKAKKFAKEFDAKHIIKDDEIYNIVPQEIFEDCDSDASGDLVQHFKHYNIEDFEKQHDRINLYRDSYFPCRIKAYEIDLLDKN